MNFYWSIIQGHQGNDQGALRQIAFVASVKYQACTICQIFDSHKWPTVLVRTVKGKPRNFEANVCGPLYSTFKTSFQPMHFMKKRLQTLFIDQLVRSKATCSFT